MSGFDLRNLREISNEPQSKFINQLAKKLAKFLNANQTEKLENKEDLYSLGQDVDSVIKIHSLHSTNSFDPTTLYYPLFEPDLDKLRLWIRGTNMGNTIPDLSLLDRTCDLYGDVLLIDGTPFDDGTHTGDTKSIALRFNRPNSDTENEESIRVDASGLDSLRVFDTTIGKSYFMRFRLFSLSDQGDERRTFFEITDDNPVTNGISVQLNSDGRVIVFIKDDGVLTKKETTTGALALDTVYDMWITYTVAGNVIHIYLNNVDKSLSTTGYSERWHGDLTDTDLYIMEPGIGGGGIGTSSGYLYADLYDFRLYDEYVVSAAEVGYMYTNKWTIANVPFGQVMVTNYWATGEAAGAASFTTTSFTSTSFT